MSVRSVYYTYICRYVNVHSKYEDEIHYVYLKLTIGEKVDQIFYSTFKEMTEIPELPNSAKSVKETQESFQERVPGAALKKPGSVFTNVFKPRFQT